MYAVLNLGYKPHEFTEMYQKEKAFVIACIDEKVNAEKREASKMKQKGRR